MFSEDDLPLLNRLTETAKDFGERFTVMKFTTNWRVGFGTPWTSYSEEKDAIEMVAGKTFAEAACLALANPQHVDCITNCHDDWKRWDREHAELMRGHLAEANAHE
jgi:hypothetical protein